MAIPRLLERYRNEVMPALQKEFGYKNIMQVPKLTKVTVNMGLGEAIQNVKILDSASQELADITGQKAVVTKARKSIASFKLRPMTWPRSPARSRSSQRRSARLRPSSCARAIPSA